MNGFAMRLQRGVRSYGFRKLAKYLAPQEYRRVKTIRGRTDGRVFIRNLSGHGILVKVRS